MLSLCAIFKNEALYLKEWVEFHLMMGVEKFYLYENNSTDNWTEVLAPYQERGVVQVIPWPHFPPSVLPAYQDCIARHRGTDQWTIFIDCDEFIYSPKYDTITEAVQTLPQAWGAIAVNWVVFGTSGKQHYEPLPIIERFTYRDADNCPMNEHVKTILRMNQGPVMMTDWPHVFKVPEGTYTTKGQRLDNTPFAEIDLSLLRVNHYVSKSVDEWNLRCITGKPDRSTPYPNTPHYYFDTKTVCDTEIQRFLPKLKERL